MSVKFRFFVAAFMLLIFTVCCIVIGFYSGEVTNPIVVNTILLLTALSGLSFPVFFVAGLRKMLEVKGRSVLGDFLLRVFRLRNFDDGA